MLQRTSSTYIIKFSVSSIPPFLLPITVYSLSQLLNSISSRARTLRIKSIASHLPFITSHASLAYPLQANVRLHARTRARTKLITTGGLSRCKFRVRFERARNSIRSNLACAGLSFPAKLHAPCCCLRDGELMLPTLREERKFRRANI